MLTGLREGVQRQVAVIGMHEVEHLGTGGGRFATKDSLEGRTHPTRFVILGPDDERIVGVFEQPRQPLLGIRSGPTDAVASGSTDANMGVVRGIPSIAIGRSYGGNQHTLTEWADWPSALPATKMLLLLAATLGDGPKPEARTLVP